MDRVLAFDDNPAIQKLVSVNLQARGYAVTAADTGEDALRLFTPGDYDLVLLDLILPGLSGLEVCTQIRQQSDVPIIGGPEVLARLRQIDPRVRAALSSGYADHPAVREWGKAGFAAFIAKPYTLRTLEETLERLA